MQVAIIVDDENRLIDRLDVADTGRNAEPHLGYPMYPLGSNGAAQDELRALSDSDKPVAGFALQGTK